jgi:hypothetical protein
LLVLAPGSSKPALSQSRTFWTVPGAPAVIDAIAKALRKRTVWVEPLFAEAKQWHGLGRFRPRGLVNVNIEALRTAAGQNLKPLAPSDRLGTRRAAEHGSSRSHAHLPWRASGAN